MLESRLEDANKLLKFYMSREKRLVDGKLCFFLKMFLMYLFVNDKHPGIFNGLFGVSYWWCSGITALGFQGKTSNTGTFIV